MDIMKKVLLFCVSSTPKGIHTNIKVHTYYIKEKISTAHHVWTRKYCVPILFCTYFVAKFALAHAISSVVCKASVFNTHRNKILSGNERKTGKR